MKNAMIFIAVIALLMTWGAYCESKKDPYEEGSHWDYSIICENGFVYKRKDRGIYQVFNSDGTPLKCGKKIY